MANMLEILTVIEALAGVGMNIVWLRRDVKSGKRKKNFGERLIDFLGCSNNYTCYNNPYATSSMCFPPYGPRFQQNPFIVGDPMCGSRRYDYNYNEPQMWLERNANNMFGMNQYQNNYGGNNYGWYNQQQGFNGPNPWDPRNARYYFGDPNQGYDPITGNYDYGYKVTQQNRGFNDYNRPSNFTQYNNTMMKSWSSDPWNMNEPYVSPWNNQNKINPWTGMPMNTNTSYINRYNNGYVNRFNQYDYNQQMYQRQNNQYQQYPQQTYRTYQQPQQVYVQPQQYAAPVQQMNYSANSYNWADSYSQCDYPYGDTSQNNQQNSWFDPSYGIMPQPAPMPMQQQYPQQVYQMPQPQPQGSPLMQMIAAGKHISPEDFVRYAGNNYNIPEFQMPYRQQPVYQQPQYVRQMPQPQQAPAPKVPSSWDELIPTLSDPYWQTHPINAFEDKSVLDMPSNFNQGHAVNNDPFKQAWSKECSIRPNFEEPKPVQQPIPQPAPQPIPQPQPDYEVVRTPGNKPAFESDISLEALFNNVGTPSASGRITEYATAEEQAQFQEKMNAMKKSSSLDSMFPDTASANDEYEYIPGYYPDGIPASAYRKKNAPKEEPKTYAAPTDVVPAFYDPNGNPLM